MNTSHVIVLPLLTLLLAGPVYATGATGHRARNAHSAAAPWHPEPYTPGAALSPGYQGMNNDRILKYLLSRQDELKKGEYETSLSYDARLTQLQNASILRKQNLYALRIAYFPSDYDADAQMLKFDRPFFCKDHLSQDSAGKWQICMLAGLERKRSSYRGANAFGVNTRVEKTRGSDFGFAVLADSPFFKSSVFAKNPDNPDMPYAWHKLSIHVPCSIEKAKSLKHETIGVLIVGHFTSLKLFQDMSEFDAPTVNAPYDTYITQYDVPFDPISVVVYVVKTGEILKAIDVKAN